MEIKEHQGIRLNHLANLTPKVATMVRSFYKTQEQLAVEREDYEQAALWRDAAVKETAVTVIDVGEHWFIKE